MKKKLLILAIAGTLCMIALTGCGEKTTQTNAGQSVETSENADPTQASGSHDATEKENTIVADADTANKAGKGSVKKPEGIYSLKDAKGVTYTFADGKMTLTESGTYSMSAGKIKLSYGQNAETEYDITETDKGFNLIHDSNLLPLVYMEGTDGLTGSEPFDGVYQIEGAQGFLFKKDGTLTVITTHECKVDEHTVTFGGGTYDWKAKKDGIELTTNGTYVMTLVP